MSENIYTKSPALTNAGMALKAKIEMGDGTLPLEITKIVIGAGINENPLNQTAVTDERKELTVTNKKTMGVRTTISVYTTNVGVVEGYPISQIGFYAIDPDDGEILYRIYQPEAPHYMPSDSERGFRYMDDFNFITSNASDVIVRIDPAGIATVEYVDNAIDEALGAMTDYPLICEEIPADLPIGGTVIVPAGDMDIVGSVTVLNNLYLSDTPPEPWERETIWGQTLTIGNSVPLNSVPFVQDGD